MQNPILGRRGFYEEIARAVAEALDKRVLGVIVFGSTVYIGVGVDIDVLVIVDGDVDLKKKFKLEHELSRRLSRVFKNRIFDVHVMSIGEFRENLEPGSFLSGLALGYQVIIDKAGVEEQILEYLKRLSREKYVLHNKYGDWNLSFYAKVLYKLKMKRRSAN